MSREVGATKIYWPCSLNKKKFKIAPNSIIEVDGLRGQIQLILLGAGVGRVPKIFVENELKEKKLIQILSSIKQPSDNVYLLYPN